jgi:hypothetical protein
LVGPSITKAESGVDNKQPDAAGWADFENFNIYAAGTGGRRICNVIGRCEADEREKGEVIRQKTEGSSSCFRFTRG